MSALPFFLNKNIAKLAFDLDLNYFDLTEDIETTEYIKKLSAKSSKVMAPQCGLAPGLICIIGNDLAVKFDKLRDI